MKTLVLNNLPELPFNVSEAINQLRVNLSFSGPEIKKIAITSSVPNEGKSFITLNLWRQMAEVGKRVLLIDTDLRLSVMRDIYDISTNGDFVGIAHLLSGQVELSDVIYKTNVPNGYILPVTNTVANPTILLESKRFSSMLDSCAETFDFVLIDTPPIGAVADALNIAKKCDGIILVVRSGSTKKSVVASAVQSLKITEKPLLGIVLNRADVSKRGGYYYYRDYYNYSSEYYNQAGKSSSKTKKKHKSR